MNYPLMILEIEVVLLGLGILLLDLWTPVEKKRDLGYLAAGLLGLILIGSFRMDASTAEYAFGKMYVFDGLALFFKRGEPLLLRGKRSVERRELAEMRVDRGDLGGARAAKILVVREHAPGLRGIALAEQ